MSFDKVRYDNDWKRQNTDVVRALIPKGKGQVIKDYAVSQRKSVSQVIVESLEKQCGLDLSK